MLEHVSIDVLLSIFGAKIVHFSVIGEIFHEIMDYWGKLPGRLQGNALHYSDTSLVR